MTLYEVNSLRTNNAAPDMLEKMGALWQQAGQAMAGAPQDGPCYGVYHHYESDNTGDYTYSIASHVKTGTELALPDDAEYRVFEAPGGQPGIGDAWAMVWGLEKEGALNRAYTWDFEMYHPDGRAEVHIALA